MSLSSRLSSRSPLTLGCEARIIDPIDGTTNFVHGIPLSVVSIGIAHRGCLVVGIVYGTMDG